MEQSELFQKLTKVLRNEVNAPEVEHYCDIYKIKLLECSSFSQKKYHLQKVLLEEILKSDPITNREFYESLLDSTLSYLNVKKRDTWKYTCIFAGCLFKGNTHRQYRSHLHNIHPNRSSYRCNHNNTCLRNFECLESLEKHCKEDHIANSYSDDGGHQEALVLSQNCKCIMLSCGQMNFESVKDLTTHISVFHLLQPRYCVFDNCEAFFKKGQSTTKHFREKHVKKNKLLLKEANCIALPSTIDNRLDHSVDDFDLCCEDDRDDSFWVDEEEDALFHQDIIQSEKECAGSISNELQMRMAWADFLNRLSNFKFIPNTSVKLVAEEYIQLSKRSAAYKNTKLEESMKKNTMLSKEQISQIIDEVVSSDPYIQIQEDLSSEKKRIAFLKQHFHFIEPEELILNPEEVKLGLKKDSVMYVPLHKALKTLIEDKTYVKVLEQLLNTKRVESCLKEVVDGSGLKENNYFKQYPGAIPLLFYSDAVELANPLGAGRCKHKIVQVFWCSGELPRSHRSQIDKLQLCLVFKEKLIKKYGYWKIFGRMVKDLQNLERTGIEVEVPVKRIVKAGILLYSADNLEVKMLCILLSYP